MSVYGADKRHHTLTVVVENLVGSKPEVGSGVVTREILMGSTTPKPGEALYLDRDVRRCPIVVRSILPYWLSVRFLVTCHARLPILVCKRRDD